MSVNEVAYTSIKDKYHKKRDEILKSFSPVKTVDQSAGIESLLLNSCAELPSTASGDIYIDGPPKIEMGTFDNEYTHVKNKTFITVFADDQLPWESSLRKHKKKLLRLHLPSEPHASKIETPIKPSKDKVPSRKSSIDHLEANTLFPVTPPRTPHKESTTFQALDEASIDNYFGSSGILNFSYICKDVIRQRNQHVDGNKHLRDAIYEPAQLDLLNKAQKLDIHEKVSDLSHFGVDDSLSTIDLGSPVHSSMESPLRRPGSSGGDTLLSSPRSVFIAGCLAQSILPQALPIRRNMTTTLDLSNRCMGDVLADCLFTSLKNMPALEALHVRGNKLTDLSLANIMRALFSLPHLKHLDISDNRVGPDALAALAAYMNYVQCTLESLNMSATELSDEDCALIFTSLIRNTSLHVLNVSHNNLGQEIKRTGKASGTESLRSLVRLISCKIHHLDISWTRINHEAVLDFCDGINDCSSLIHLDLSNLRLGKDASVVIGSSLFENKNMATLVLVNCGIESFGCFTIACGARECLSLKKLLLDGNSIGEAGLRMLLSLAYTCASRDIEISMKRCDTLTKNKLLLDINDPFGVYNLQLSTGYGRCVFSELLNLASHNENIVFDTFAVADDTGSNSLDKTPVTLKRILRDRRGISDDERLLLKELTETYHVAGDKSKVTLKLDEAVLFQTPDRKLPVEALASFLDTLGITRSVEDIKMLMGGKALFSRDDCFQYFTALKKESIGKIHDIKNDVILVSSQAPRERYRSPSEGQVAIEVRETFADVPERLALTAREYQRLVAIAANSDSLPSSLWIGIQGKSVRLPEALDAHHIMCQTLMDEVSVMSRLLLNVTTPLDALMLIKCKLGSNINRLYRLKTLIGCIYGPLIGHYNGYYRLNLCNENDRFCLVKLIQRSEKAATYRKDNGLPDISQKSNWSCFRNVMYRKKVDEEHEGKDAFGCIYQHELANQKCSVQDMLKLGHVPRKGLIEFDFCVVEKPDGAVISDHAVISGLVECGIIPASSIEVCLEDLTLCDLWSKRGVYSPEVCRGVRDLYSKLPSRRSQAIEAHQLALQLHSGVNEAVTTWTSLVKTMANANASFTPLLQKESIMYHFASVPLMAKHICMIAKLYANQSKNTDFGTLRVELIIFLMSNVVDIENMHTVCQFLTDNEISCLIARVGYLAGLYSQNAACSVPSELDLTMPQEERAVAYRVVSIAAMTPAANKRVAMKFRLLDYAECASWTMGDLLPASYFEGTDPTSPMFKVLRITSIEAEIREYLKSLKWSAALMESYLSGLHTTNSTYFIINDSASMLTADSARYVKDGTKYTASPCSRWTELVDTINFHAAAASIAEGHSHFYFMNNASPIVVGPKAAYSSLMAALEKPPNGTIPLCQRLTEIAHEIKGQASQVISARQSIHLLVTTDGEASDGDITAVLSTFAGLPVIIVIRLCSDDSAVIDYWNKIRMVLPFPIQLIRRLAKEAELVSERNGWLVYTEAVHRLREAGYCPLLNSIGEAAFDQEQARATCSYMYGSPFSSRLPLPRDDWESFSSMATEAEGESQYGWAPVYQSIAQRAIDLEKLRTHLGIFNVESS